MLVYQFPGQGAQFKGMGQDLFADFPEQIKQANEILGYSITTLCLEDPLQQLNLTQFTQPAIFIVNALAYLKKLRTAAQKPDYVIGHSLGEYSALFAAGVFDFHTGLQLVKKRGELMSQMQNGGMVAVMGLTADQVHNVLDQNKQFNLSIANFNSYTQFVLSGRKEEINQIQSVFAHNTSCQIFPLNVSGPFHSNYMQDAQDNFAKFLEDFTLSPPTLPVLANINYQPYHPAICKSNLIKQIGQPVFWTQSIEYFMQFNADIEEIGNAKVLTKLLTRIRNGQ